LINTAHYFVDLLWE